MYLLIHTLDMNVLIRSEKWTCQFPQAGAGVECRDEFIPLKMMVFGRGVKKRPHMGLAEGGPLEAAERRRRFSEE